MTYKNIKFAIFSAIVLSMIASIAGINMANASKMSVGSIADGTYNEELAFQRATDLVNTHDAKIEEKTQLEQKLTAKENEYGESIKNSKFIDAASLLAEVQRIKVQLSNVQEEINGITQEYDEIQKENMKLYYIEPSLYEKYVAAKDDAVNKIQARYWEGKSFKNAKNEFPLVGAGINHKAKSVEIILSKDAENSPKKDEYIAILSQLMPKDIPWFISYSEYAIPTACASRTSACDPLIGGIQINVQGHGYCTLGIQATRSGLDGWITAGHCADGSAVGTDVFQPNGGSAVGDLQAETFANNSACDCAFVADRPLSSPAMDNAIFQSSSSTYTPITATSSGGQAGQMVKKSGVTTGNTLGTVVNTSISLTYNGATITNLVRSTMNVDCGDSGGPVTNGLGSSFYGIVVAKTGSCGSVTNDAYHTPYDKITAVLSANPVLG